MPQSSSDFSFLSLITILQSKSVLQKDLHVDTYSKSQIEMYYSSQTIFTEAEGKAWREGKYLSCYNFKKQYACERHML